MNGVGGADTNRISGHRQPPVTSLPKGGGAIRGISCGSGADNGPYGLMHFSLSVPAGSTAPGKMTASLVVFTSPKVIAKRRIDGEKKKREEFSRSQQLP